MNGTDSNIVWWIHIIVSCNTRQKWHIHATVILQQSHHTTHKQRMLHMDAFLHYDVGPWMENCDVKKKNPLYEHSQFVNRAALWESLDFNLKSHIKLLIPYPTIMLSNVNHRSSYGWDTNIARCEIASLEHGPLGTVKCVCGGDFLYRRMVSEARGDLFVKATCLENSDQSLTLILTE